MRLSRSTHPNVVDASITVPTSIHNELCSAVLLSAFEIASFAMVLAYLSVPQSERMGTLVRQPVQELLSNVSNIR